jgi:phosphoglycerate dehydrogenase-like enzyme
MRPARKPALLPTRVFPRDVMARARRDYAVLVENPEDTVLTADELVRRAAGAEAILCAAGDPLHAETIARLPGTVRAIATFSVGLDHIDLAAARARGIVVTNTPDVLTEATAETTMPMMVGSMATRPCLSGLRAERPGRLDGFDGTTGGAPSSPPDSCGPGSVGLPPATATVTLRPLPAPELQGSG